MISLIPNNNKPEQQQTTIQQKYPSIMNNINIKQKQWPSYIDLTNIQTTASLQYLHNYTYLQYSMFPQLFEVYINTIEVDGLVQKLNSYIGTFMEFFIDGIPYENSYDVNMLMIDSKVYIDDVKEVMKQCIGLSQNNSQILKKLYNLTKQISILKSNKNNNNNYNQKQDSSQQQQQQMLLKIIDQIKTKKHVFKGLFNLICLLVKKILFQKQSLHALIHCPMPKYLLHCVIMELEKESNKRLFKIEKQQLSNNLQEVNLLLKQNYLVKILPIYIQVYGLYMSITNGRMKLIDVTGWDWQRIINNIDLSIELQKIVKILKFNVIGDIIKTNIKGVNQQNSIQKQQNISIQNQQQSNIKNCQISDCRDNVGLFRMTRTIKQCFNIDMRIKEQEKRIPKQLKQLSIENIQKLSRQFNKLLNQTQQYKKQNKLKQIITNKKHVQNNGYNENNYKMQQGNKYKMQQEEQIIKSYKQHQQQIKHNKQIIDLEQQQQQELYQVQQNKQIKQSQLQSVSQLLGELPQIFLLPYYKLLELLHQYEQQQLIDWTTNNNIHFSQHTITNNKSIKDQTIKYLINQLFNFINTQLRKILTLTNIDLTNSQCQSQQKGIIDQYRKRVHQLELEIGLVIEIMEMIQDSNNNNISTVMQSQQLTKDSSTTITTQQPYQSQPIIQSTSQQFITTIKKIKHSLYVNLLTLKILSYSLNTNSVKQNIIQQQQQKQQQHMKQELTIKMISEMFDSVFQLATTNSLKSQTNTNNNNNKTNIDKSNSIVIENINSYPSLQTVLYMFSAVQLFLQLNHTNIKYQQPSKIQTKQQLSNTNNQVHIFLSNVINKYSQPNITIPPQQLIYVKYIIEIFQIFNVFVVNKTNTNIDKTNTNSNTLTQKDNKLSEKKDNNKEDNKIVEKLRKLVKLSEQRKDQCRVRIQQMINILPCLQKYIQKLIPALISFTLCPQQQNKQQCPQQLNKQQQRKQKQEQYFIQFEILLFLSNKDKQQILTYKELISYINNEIIQKLSTVFMFMSQKNDKSKQKQIINLNESNISDNNKQQALQLQQSELIITSRQMYSKVKRVFIQLSRKYFMITKMKQQLLSININNSKKLNTQSDMNNNSKKLNTQSDMNNNNKKINIQSDCYFDKLFDNCYNKCFGFVIQATQILIQNSQIFWHLHSQYTQIITNKQQQTQSLPLTTISSLYIQQLHSVINKLSTTCLSLTKLIQQKIINLRLMLYKLSPQQIQYLVKQQKWQNNQQNKNQILQKIKLITKYIDTLIKFGILLRTYSQYMLMETIIKKEYLTKSIYQQGFKQQQQTQTNFTIQQTNLTIKQTNINIQQNNLNVSSTLSSLHLLRLITLISWLNNTNINSKILINFEYLEQILQSNIIQPQLISTSLSNHKQSTTKFKLNKLPLTHQVKQQLHFIQNYQHLQFIYQYLPFEITNYQQQKQLLQQIQNYVSNQDNHLYLSQQKLQKVRFNKLSAYIQQLKTSQIYKN